MIAGQGLYYCKDHNSKKIKYLFAKYPALECILSASNPNRYGPIIGKILNNRTIPCCIPTDVITKTFNLIYGQLEVYSYKVFQRKP
jgi:hypothetical protein